MGIKTVDINGPWFGSENSRLIWSLAGRFRRKVFSTKLLKDFWILFSKIEILKHCFQLFVKKCQKSCLKSGVSSPFILFYFDSTIPTMIFFICFWFISILTFKVISFTTSFFFVIKTRFFRFKKTYKVSLLVSLR